MPLYADHEGMLVVFDRLDDPPVVAGDGPKSPAKPVDGLVMQRIDPQSLLAEDAVQTAVHPYVYPLARKRRSHAWQVFKKTVNVRDRKSTRLNSSHVKISYA